MSSVGNFLTQRRQDAETQGPTEKFEWDVRECVASKVGRGIPRTGRTSLRHRDSPPLRQKGNACALSVESGESEFWRIRLHRPRNSTLTLRQNHDANGMLRIIIHLHRVLGVIPWLVLHPLRKLRRDQSLRVTQDQLPILGQMFGGGL